jgi:cobalamin biosynthesis protein CobT
MSFKINFESTLEKVGRIIARQYGIEVRFEGNKCQTDGKTITLPHFESLDDNLKRLMHGFLDHEVAHCKFTKMDEMGKAKTKFHKTLLNAVEDSRIEREMIEEYPGCALHLIPMNEELRAKINQKENWEKLPYPVRTIIAIRDLMDGREPIIDEDIERYIDVVKDAAIELRDCKNTEELRIATGEIVKRIIEEREEEKEEEKSGKGEEGDEGEGEDKDSDGVGSGKSKDKGKTKSSKGKPSGSPSEGDDKSGGDEMLEESADEKDSEFDKHMTTVGEMMEKEIEKAVKKDAEEMRRGGGAFLKPEFGTQLSVPITTRFDKVTDYSGKGDARNYGRLKDQVKPQVSPIKQTLERILKVKENAKWKTEQERGRLNPRDLAKLATDKSYRTPFREFHKTETKNVAIEILIDESGSMSGSKTHTTKMAAIAFAEALKDLQIPFEITGFTSVPDSRVSAYAASVKDKSRFNRTSERLELDIFKSFESHSLLGLDKIEAKCQNPDGECVAWAAKRLALRKEKRKILMVLSDGQPATGDGAHAKLCTDLRKKVELISKSGIEVVGIGIETSAVKDYYPDYLVLNSVSELPVAGMKKLSKLIAKG